MLDEPKLCPTCGAPDNEATAPHCFQCFQEQQNSVKNARRSTQPAEGNAQPAGEAGLPPLPRAAYYDRVTARMSGEGIGYTAEQMLDYARQAIAADRASRAEQPKELP